MKIDAVQNAKKIGNFINPISSTVDLARHIKDDVITHKERLSKIADAAKHLFWPRPASSYRVETFDDAITRLHLSEADMTERRRQLLIEARICYAGVFACLLNSLWMASEGATLGFASSITVGFSVFFTLANSKAFRVWQIDNRKLGGFNAWLHQPAEWFP